MGDESSSTSSLELNSTQTLGLLQLHSTQTMDSSNKSPSQYSQSSVSSVCSEPHINTTFNNNAGNAKQLILNSTFEKNGHSNTVNISVSSQESSLSSSLPGRNEGSSMGKQNQVGTESVSIVSLASGIELPKKFQVAVKRVIAKNIKEVQKEI